MKTRRQIFKENIFTLFNFLNFGIAALLFAVGAYSNMLFIAIILVNIAVGITQEFKAKRLVEQLSILNRPRVKLWRSEREVEVDLHEVALGDVLVLESGMQIANDAVVLSGSMEVNESLLTGESDGIVKEVGSQLLSGSSVISGKCHARVIHVGDENYAAKLTKEVKQAKKTESELLGSMQKVTQFTSVLLVPLGILLFVEAMLLRHGTFEEAVVSSAAALLGMLPKGLVLLISVSLANGVIRLSKQKILVQNIYALETLAHVDVLCLDKTGTLTDGNLTLKEAHYVGKNKEADREIARKLVASYLAASDDNNATAQALREEFRTADPLPSVHKIPFSSKRKWGAVSLLEKGTVFVGAPERLVGEDAPEMETFLNAGCRLIAIAHYLGMWEDEEVLPKNLKPLYLVALEDTVQKNAKETLAYFYQEGVDVKVISGDHVRTVSQVAKKAGLKRWMDAVDLSKFTGHIDYNRLCQEYAVFARVTPKQKEELVKALKRNGHKVAMTGDGVNDLLALREADCSIAVAAGSDSSRQLAQIVLLESDFTHLPQVVLEGRKVVNNVTRTASVFFIKTIYSVLLTIFCLVANLPFPFIPIQITLIDAAMEAWPSFLTILESDTRKIRGSFLTKALANALPFALVITSMLLFVHGFFPLAAAEAQTVMYLLLMLTTMAAVVKSCVPFNRLRIFICLTMAAGAFGGLLLLPGLFQVVALTPAMLASFLTVAAMGGVLLTVFLKGKQILEEDFEEIPE